MRDSECESRNESDNESDYEYNTKARDRKRVIDAKRDEIQAWRAEKGERNDEMSTQRLNILLSRLAAWSPAIPSVTRMQV